MELIKFSFDDNGNIVISARELYEFLGHDVSNWSRWYPKNITNNTFAVEEEDYVELVIKTSSNNGTHTKDFALTLNFAKKLCMLARTERGEQARQYFIDCEMKLKAIQASANFLPDELLTTINEMIDKAQKIAENKLEKRIENLVHDVNKGIEASLNLFSEGLNQCYFNDIEERLEKLEKLNFPALGTANAFVYITQEGNTDIYKIGQSTQPDIRTEKLNTGNSQHLTIIKKIPFLHTKESATFEKHLQIVFLSKQIKGEWYKLNAQDLQMIDQLAYIYSKRVKENN